MIENNNRYELDSDCNVDLEEADELNSDHAGNQLLENQSSQPTSLRQETPQKTANFNDLMNSIIGKYSGHALEIETDQFEENKVIQETDEDYHSTPHSQA